MRKIFCTTFNKQLYDRYANQLIDTYLQTNQTIPLHVFVEDLESVHYPKHPNVFYHNLFEEEPELKKFVERNKGRPFSDFLGDAVRFSYKVFAQNASRKYGDKIYYVDSDSKFIRQIPNEWYDECLPDDTFIAFYDRPNTYTETGFVAFNENKIISKQFFNQYTRFYIEDIVYTLNSYTDCHTLDETRRICKEDIHYKENKLGDGANGHIMARDKFINPYLDHRKGERKFKPHSDEWLKHRPRHGG